MRLPSTVGLLAFITTASVPLVVTSTQALIHVEVDRVESMDHSSDYFTESALVPMAKEQADQLCAKGKKLRLPKYNTHSTWLISMKQIPPTAPTAKPAWTVPTAHLQDVCASQVPVSSHVSGCNTLLQRMAPEDAAHSVRHSPTTPGHFVLIRSHLPNWRMLCWCS